MAPFAMAGRYLSDSTSIRRVKTLLMMSRLYSNYAP